jgi:hypothetical protein
VIYLAFDRIKRRFWKTRVVEEEGESTQEP